MNYKEQLLAYLDRKSTQDKLKAMILKDFGAKVSIRVVFARWEP